MSDQNFDAGCNGNCSSCGSDCEPGQATVTLTLDNDEVLECAILTIFPVGGNQYIALLLLWKISKMMMNTILLQKALITGWIHRNSIPWIWMISWNNYGSSLHKAIRLIIYQSSSPIKNGESFRGFPFFSFMEQIQSFSDARVIPT